MLLLLLAVFAASLGNMIVGGIACPAFATAGVLVLLRYPRRTYWAVAIAGVLGGFCWILWSSYGLGIPPSQGVRNPSLAYALGIAAVLAVVTTISVLIARGISKRIR